MAIHGKYTDAELVERLKKGDHAAFTAIYDRYTPLLYQFAFKKLQNREETKDLVHELFYTLWEKRETLQLSGELAPYLYTSARNRILDHIAHGQVEARHIASLQQYIQAGHSSTDHQVRHRQLLALIEQEVAALPPKMRQVYELSRQGNLSRKEIAATLGLSEQTVKSHMHHAISHLRTRFGKLFTLLCLFI